MHKAVSVAFSLARTFLFLNGTRKVSWKVARLFPVVCMSLVCHAQGPQGGDPSFSPIENHGFYSIDLQDLHINTTVPIRSKTGFGTYTVTGSNFYSIIGSAWSLSPPLPQHGGTVGLVGYQVIKTRMPFQQTCNGQLDTIYTYSITDRQGTSHSIPNLRTDTLGCYSGGTATSNDGSGITLTVPSNGNVSAAVITDRSGNTSTAGTNQVDPNGNTVTWNGATGVFTDTLATTAVTFNAASQTQYKYTYTGGDGGTTEDDINYALKNLKTLFGCTTPPDVTGNFYGPTSVVFGSGSSQQQTLSFGYEATPNNSGYYTGRLSSITLPTGGQITFAYSGGNAGINCADGSTNTLTRTTPDGTWKYVHTVGTWGTVNSTTAVTNPLGNETDYAFVNQFLVQVRQCSGACTGTNNLADTFVCYNSGYTGCTPYGTAYTATPAFPITQKDTYSRLAGHTQYTVDNQTYDNYGNLLNHATWANGASQSAPSGLLVVQYTRYGTWTGSACAAVGTSGHINNRLCYVQIYDGSNTLLSQTTFTYDGSGNRLTSQSWVGGTNYLTSSATYNANGSVATTTDMNGTKTTVTGTMCGSPTGLLPTGVSLPRGNGQTLTGSKSWDCNGGGYFRHGRE
jgi:hypothetical protein